MDDLDLSPSTLSTLSRRSYRNRQSVLSPGQRHISGDSLAHELLASTAGGGGGGARALAEEFGIELGDENDPDDLPGSSLRSGSPLSNNDLQFGRLPNDEDEANLFGSRDPVFATEYDDNGHVGDSYYSQHNGFDPDDPHGMLDPSLSLGSELTFADSIDAGHEEEEIDGLDPRMHHLHLVDEDVDLDSQTPTRGGTIGHRRRTRARAGMSALRSQGDDEASTSSSPSSSSSRLRLQPSSDDESGEEDLPPQRLLFASASSVPLSPSAVTAGGEPASLAVSTTFLPLLKLDDRSFEVEHAAQALAKQLDESARAREEMSREMTTLDREVQRLVSDGLRFAVEAEDGDGDEGETRDWSNGYGGHEGVGASFHDRKSSLQPLGEEDDGEEEEDEPFATNTPLRRVQAEYEDETPVSSPLKRRSYDHSTSGFSPFSKVTPSSPYRRKRSSHEDDPDQENDDHSLAPPTLTVLYESTSSLLISLASLSDAAQITLSSAADAGRRLRALRTNLGGLKEVEDAVERARRGVEVWDGWGESGNAPAVAGEGEDTATLESSTATTSGSARRDLKGEVEREMEQFKQALERFEARTQGLRDLHHAFLVGH